MILKRTIIAKIDPETGLFLKQIQTSNGDHFSRSLAINNSFYYSELKRILFKKPLLESMLQVHHIHYDKRLNKWRMCGGDDAVENAMAHAESQGRLFLPYCQLNETQWDALDWKMAESIFTLIARRGSSLVPYPLPLDADLDDWKERRKLALQILNKSQELVPILCLNHDPFMFHNVLKYEFKEGKLLGLHYFNIADVLPFTNLICLFNMTTTLTVGTEVPLVIGLCPQMRYLKNKYSSASIAYILTLFGIDFVSYTVYSPEQVAKIEEQGPEDFKFYDSTEGGYNNSATQLTWYGQELTRTRLESISTNEGLDPSSAHRWANFLRENEDLDLLNNAIINERAKDLIKTKSRWHVAVMQIFSEKKWD